MTAFKIKSSSLLIYELTFLIITFGGTFLGFYLGKTAGNDAYIFILLLVGLTLVVFIPDLLSYFEKQIAAYNEKDLNILHPIRRRKTFYETRLGTVMAILTALGLLAIPILFDAFPATKIDLYPRVFGYTGGIYFISKVIVYRIKKSRHQLPI